ncbi:MAG: zinc ribbon domain-containing protein [Methanobacteriaceae archaeon]|nr:zinc ribbon domain-containing protein [Methanobacteriaceae archaeon]
MENFICDNCGKQYTTTEKKKEDKCDCSGKLVDLNDSENHLVSDHQNINNSSNLINLTTLLFSFLIVIPLSVIIYVLGFNTNFIYLMFLTPVIVGILIGYYLTNNIKDTLKYSFISVFSIYFIIYFLNFRIFLLDLSAVLLVSFILSGITGVLTIPGALIGTYLNKDKKVRFGGRKISSNIQNSFKKTCDKCGTENNSNSKFCVRCGNNLIYTQNKCFQCGTKNSSTSQFCKECGQELEKELVSNPKIQGYENLRIREGLEATEFIIILLFSPIAGFIGFIWWHDTKPLKGKQSAIIAIIMFVIWLIIVTLIFISYMNYVNQLNYYDSLYYPYRY